MSTKHFFPSTEGVVLLGLKSLVARNTHLALDTANKVVYSRTHQPSKVSLISGGGSGHEPAWSGYVGDGMLAAAVSGEVFASPSTKQVMAAIDHVSSDAGIILCITNYTGDNLHFGLAKEKAAARGRKVALLRMTDDVALGRKQTANLGRRGLAGNMFVLKLSGSAAAAGHSLESCYALGQAVNDNCVTVGSSLDHCHIPGREHYRAVPTNACVLGMGIHNEPGLHEIEPMPPVEKLVANMLKYCLDPDDQDRSFVTFEQGDTVLLLVNNFGGMSNFELEALTTVTKEALESQWSIKPARTYVQAFETSLNAPGWSLSLLNLSGVERNTYTPMETLLSLLDADTTAPAWPKNGIRDLSMPEQRRSELHTIRASDRTTSPAVNGDKLDKALRIACKAATQAEPDLTRWDTQMGDGDCGEAVVNMCQGILKKLDTGLTSNGNLFFILDEIEEAIEEVGGTLGAIVSILVASFAAQIQKAVEEHPGTSVDMKMVGGATGSALRNLMSYTSAPVGGRTVMDTLIPFCETLEQDADLAKAVAAAQAGAKSTAGMAAKFGRAAYVGEQRVTAMNDLPPDPGAMAAAIFLQGLLDGLGGA